MPELSVQSNSLQYTGQFSSPALNLWGKGDQIFSGLYAAFREYGITLESFTALDGPPAEQGVSIKLGSRSTFEFKLDRFVLNLTNFVDTDLAKLPHLLDQATEWIQGVIPNHSFFSHLCTYTSHSLLSEGDAETILKSLTKLPNRGPGKARASGIIYHFDVDDYTSVHLTIDHSLLVEKGVWLNYYLYSTNSQLAPSALANDGRRYLEEILSNASLLLPVQEQIG